jgi:hypothetical protein
MARKATEYVQFKLRIRESLRRRIEREAEKKNQSANAEAVERLEDSFTAHEKSQRSTDFIDALLRNDASADLLHWLQFQLQLNPKWDESEVGRDAMARAFRAYVLSSDGLVDAIRSAREDVQ